MISILWSICAFIFAMFILVAFHEFGHYIFAKKLGVKVLAFSIGFGKPLMKWLDKSGTVYQIAWLPLGGYVKMLDESEGQVDPSELHQAFNRQTLYKRMLIVLAGPLFNFILAFFCFLTMYLIGIKSLIPIIGEITPHSIAAQAELKPQEQIISVGNVRVTNWQSVQLALMRHIGSDTVLPIRLSDVKTHITHTLSLDLRNWTLSPNRTDPLTSIGISPYVPPLPPIIGRVMPHSIAEKFGIKPNDEIISIDEQIITNWEQFTKVIQDNPLRKLFLRIERDDEEFTLPIIPAAHMNGRKQSIGIIGVSPFPMEIPDELFHVEHYGVLTASSKALEKTAYLTKLTFIFVGKLIVGDVSLAAVSGPIGFAQGAGQSASFGLIAYLGFLALISISLAVLNLLPIPLLDGGHFLNYVIELLRGKALSEKSQERSMKVGFLAIISLSIVAIYNDIMRLMQ